MSITEVKIEKQGDYYLVRSKEMGRMMLTRSREVAKSIATRRGWAVVQRWSS